MVKNLNKKLAIFRNFAATLSMAANFQTTEGHNGGLIDEKGRDSDNGAFG